MPNIDIAWNAIRQTRLLLPNGSANRLSPNSGPRHLVLELLEHVRSQGINSQDELTRLLCEAKIAIAGKTGNCGEMASVGFAVLYCQTQAAIDYRFFPNDAGDHAFVVIGQPGHDEVVCDPWAQDAYPSAEFPSRMNALYRGNPPNPNTTRSRVRAAGTGSYDDFNRRTASQSAADLMDISEDTVDPIEDAIPMDLSRN